MAATKRSSFEREDDYRRITDMYLQGKSQADIAAVLGLARQQIGYDIAIIQKRWRADTSINIDEAKQKELARIDTLEREYWTAWERTLDERTKTRTEQSTAGKDSKTAKATIEKETMLGNPAYLNGVQWCISERCKLLGLYAPTKIAPTTPDGLMPYVASDDLAKARAEALAIESKLLADG